MASRWWLPVILSAGSVMAVNAMQGPEVAGVMREKLARSQKILEAVVTSDWSALEAQAKALEQLTDDNRWRVFKTPEYSRRSAAFKDAVRNLRTAAEHRDLEQTPKAYTAVTMECVNCHRYLARARLALVNPFVDGAPLAR